MRARAPMQTAWRSTRFQKRPRRKRILLADDDCEMRSLIAVALARDGFDVVEARDGAELLSRLAEAFVRSDSPRFDLIITDHRMPRVAGLDVLRGLRLSHNAPPVILITAFGGREMRNVARSLGAVAVFDKPFQMDDLRTAVQFVFSPAFEKIRHNTGGAND